MERIILENDCDYHIYNRGTDKRQVFYDKSDYYRFIHYLYIANDARPFHLRDSEDPDFRDTDREEIVDIIAYVLMPNHFHVLARQKVIGGISKFMQKLCTGYTMYFNKKRERSGVLFQGRYKCKYIGDEAYLPTVIKYIHLNPLKLREKTGNHINTKSIEEFLRKYKWSSCPDYLGEKNFPSVINTKIFSEIFENADDHRDFILENFAPDEIGIPDDILIDSRTLI